MVFHALLTPIRTVAPCTSAPRTNHRIVENESSDPAFSENIRSHLDHRFSMHHLAASNSLTPPGLCFRDPRRRTRLYLYATESIIRHASWFSRAYVALSLLRLSAPVWKPHFDTPVRRMSRIPTRLTPDLSILPRPFVLRYGMPPALDAGRR